jgi:thioredoxin 1
MIPITLDSVNSTIKNNIAVVLYFSASSCNVCHALKPKLFDSIKTNFKEFEIVDIDISNNQNIAAYFNVFSIPTVLIFLDSKEFSRKSRNMSVELLVEEIRRPYEIMIS